MFDLKHIVRGRSALVLHEATAAALAAINGLDLRHAAELMVQTAFFKVASDEVRGVDLVVIKMLAALAGGVSLAQ